MFIYYSPKKEHFRKVAATRSNESNNKIKKVWNQISGGGYAKNLLESGIVKNTKRMRFQTKTISLFDEER